MADTKITALAALTGANVATGDELVIVDVSDTTMAASGTDKNITATELVAAVGALGGSTEFNVLDLKPAGLTGATTATRYVGGTASGPPASGTFSLGDFVLTQAGDVIVCVTAGSPGTWLRVARSRGIYGDGSDGTVTLGAGATTLAKDMFYDTLTVPNGAELVTNDYRVYCYTKCQIDSGGKIDNDGAVGTTGAGGGNKTSTTLGRNGAGGNGGTAAGSAGSAAATSPSIAGSGGNGGNGSGGAGGAGGTVTAPSSTSPTFRMVPFSSTGVAFNGSGGSMTNLIICGGPGGGGGGGDGTAGGGGGGAGGGPVLIAAREIVNNGTITAKGGAGGSPTTGNRGGGGGGGGGPIVLTYDRYSGTGTLDASGGAGAAGTGTGTAGAAGSAGTILQVVNS